MLNGWKAFVHSENLRLEAPGEGPTYDPYLSIWFSAFIYVHKVCGWLFTHLPGHFIMDTNWKDLNLILAVIFCVLFYICTLSLKPVSDNPLPFFYIGPIDILFLGLN